MCISKGAPDNVLLSIAHILLAKLYSKRACARVSTSGYSADDTFRVGDDPTGTRKQTSHPHLNERFALLPIVKRLSLRTLFVKR